MRGREAVVETDMGTVVLQLLPEIAPNHVEVVQQISAVDADERSAPRSRIAIRSVTIRHTPNVPGVVSMARGEDPASGSPIR